jgi:hypothetical protein
MIRKGELLAKTLRATLVRQRATNNWQHHQQGMKRGIRKNATDINSYFVIIGMYVVNVNKLDYYLTAS